MKLVLISIYDSLDSNGIRLLSSHLKSKGHDVKIIFTPFSVESAQINARHGETSPSIDLKMRFSKAAMQNMYELFKDADAIGVGLFSPYFVKARNLSRAIKGVLADNNHKPIPIIWGGIHPTIFPRSCVDFADYVVIGDGEETTSELLAHIDKANNGIATDLSNIRGICYKKNHDIIFNSPRPNQEDLDEYPSQDFDLEDHYILRNNELLHMTPELLHQYMGDMYTTIITRGCPHSCTYCGNNALRDASCGKYLRYRSVDHVIGELEHITRRFPFFKQIAIQDDVFFIRPYDYIKEFADKYKERIGYPISGNVSPLTVSEQKIQVMVDAGLKNLTMGVQSGSDRINLKVYKRMTPRENILKSMDILNKYAKSGELQIGYQFIIDNPYETYQDIKDTADFLLRIPKPYTAGFYPLVFYPGTQIYVQAKKDGKIIQGVNDFNQSYWAFERSKYFNFPTYAMLMVYFSQGKFSRKFSRFLYKVIMNKVVMRILDNILVTRSIYYAGYTYRKLFNKGFGMEIA